MHDFIHVFLYRRFKIYFGAHILFTLFSCLFNLLYKLQPYYTHSIYRSNRHYMCCWKTRYKCENMGCFDDVNIMLPPTFFGSLIYLKKNMSNVQFCAIHSIFITDFVCSRNLCKHLAVDQFIDLRGGIHIPL